MTFLQIYLLGFGISEILTISLMQINSFFYYIMDKQLLSEPELKNYAEQIAYMKNTNVYNILYPLFIFIMGFLSVIGIIGILFLFLEFIEDYYSNKNNDNTNKPDNNEN